MPPQLHVPATTTVIHSLVLRTDKSIIRVLGGRHAESACYFFRRRDVRKVTRAAPAANRAKVLGSGTAAAPPALGTIASAEFGIPVPLVSDRSKANVPRALTDNALPLGKLASFSTFTVPPSTVVMP